MDKYFILRLTNIIKIEETDFTEALTAPHILAKEKGHSLRENGVRIQKIEKR